MASYYQRMTAIRCWVLAIPLAAVLAGCLETDIPPAGSYSEVLLVTDEGAADPFSKLLTPHIAKTLDFYVSEDIEFRVQQVRAVDVEEVPYIKNIVFCGVASPVTDVGRRISSLIGKNALQRVQSDEAHIFQKKNLPGRGQITLIITAASAEALYDVIEERGDEVADILEASCRTRLRDYLLKNRRSDLTRTFQQKYGFTIEIPGFYRLLSDESDPPGIELLRDGPARLLGIFWVDWNHYPTIEDRQELYDIRAQYVFARYDGDVMDPSRVSYTIEPLGDMYAVKMEGYWSNTNSLAGGYYKTYFVFDEEERLLWCVDLLVYAPGLPKHAHFRELLAIAETFRY